MLGTLAIIIFEDIFGFDIYKNFSFNYGLFFKLFPLAFKLCKSGL